jgi:hypothetical protein
MLGLCGCCYANRQQHRNEKFLFDLFGRHPVQIRLASDHAYQRGGLQELAGAEVNALGIANPQDIFQTILPCSDIGTMWPAQANLRSSSLSAIA